MHLDVQRLHSFYYRSAIGRVAQRVVRDKVSRLCAGEDLPETRGLGGYERNMVLLELSEIMEVYGDECAGQGTRQHEPALRAANGYTSQRS